MAAGRGDSRGAGASSGDGATAAWSSGAEMAAAIEREAARRGVSPAVFAAPVSRWPSNWLLQLRAAHRPTARTVARVRALLAGEAVPPPRPAPPPEPSAADIPRPADRTPCFRCGIRADVGCGHRRWA